MSEQILQIEGVTKQFASVCAVDKLSLQMKSGESVALLGHNGAGKTTLFRLILGFTKPDQGAIRVKDHVPGSDAARSFVSYLPENITFAKSLTGCEILTFFAKLKKADTSRISDTLEQVGLGDAANRRAETYSKGMRQRLGLAQALIGEPHLLLLDEPTSGLDPISRQDFYKLIDVVAKNGAAVLLSSHSLSEVENRTDRVAIMKSGKLVADASLAQLQTDAAVPFKIIVKAHRSNVDEVRKRLGGKRINGQHVELSCLHHEKMGLLNSIGSLGDLVTDLDVAQPSLDDVFKHYSTDTPKEAGS
ncbi:MAG: ABC transporter ATP-binding protein [Hyphomicrobiales bacterium]